MSVPPSRPRRRAGAPGAPATTRVSAIDIGSNTIRQIVADVSGDGAIAELDELEASPRLGAGLGTTGVLAEDAIAAAIEALGRMAALARRLECDRVVTVATSAVRDASNGARFLERVRVATGLEARILSGEEEARLCFRSALAHFDLASGGAVVADIGGGSLELAFSTNGVLERVASLPLGAVRLTERFAGAVLEREHVAVMRRHVREVLRDAVPMPESGRARVIGSGGTFTNLARVHLARQGALAAASLPSTRVPRADLEETLEWLARLGVPERAAVPGLEPGRADIIVAGLAVAAEVLAHVGTDELQVSRYGIREGLLLDAAGVSPRAHR